MPIWIIELFGARDLNVTFLVIALMTAPLWVGMIAFPQAACIKHLAHPWLIVPLYTLVLLLIVWKSSQSEILPEPVLTANYQSAQNFAQHPVVFLVLFCNLQIINLFMGVIIYQKAMRSGFTAPVELTLCWFLGAVALLPFALRLILRKGAGL
jgi:hypothetical protein